jgi:hypothetical protein
MAAARKVGNLRPQPSQAHIVNGRELLASSPPAEQVYHCRAGKLPPKLLTNFRNCGMFKYILPFRAIVCGTSARLRNDSLFF